MSKNLKKILDIEGEPIFENLNTKLSPFEIFEKLYATYKDIFIFESLDGPKELIKSSIIGFEPKYKIRCLSKKLLIFKKEKKIDDISIINPLNNFNEFFTSVKNKHHRYVGGLVGYINYESIKYWEDIHVKNSKHFPLMEFGLYTDGIVYDHDKNKLEYFYYKESRLQNIEKILNNNSNNKYENIPEFTFSNLSRNIEKKEFVKKVKKVKKYLNRGDIFQTVLSKKIKFVCNGNPLLLYRNLRKINPSPYMFFFRLNEHILIGSSPEMLIRITNNKVETYPIAWI